MWDGDSGTASGSKAQQRVFKGSEPTVWDGDGILYFPFIVSNPVGSEPTVWDGDLELINTRGSS